jgi:hypothetical protein
MFGGWRASFSYNIHFLNCERAEVEDESPRCSIPIIETTVPTGNNDTHERNLVTFLQSNIGKPQPEFVH